MGLFQALVVGAFQGYGMVEETWRESMSHPPPAIRRIGVTKKGMLSSRIPPLCRRATFANGWLARSLEQSNVTPIRENNFSRLKTRSNPRYLGARTYVTETGGKRNVVGVRVGSLRVL